MLHRSNSFHYHFFSAIFICTVFFSQAHFCQTNRNNLPDKIRGYKVHKTDVSVLRKGAVTDGSEGIKVFVDLGKPKPSGLSLFGITFDISASVDVRGQSGTVDFITFSDIRINGKTVTVSEHQTSFRFKKKKSVQLEPPIRVSVGAFSTLRTALEELTDSKDHWQITGRALVFGKFKKGFFKFKRVIPVDINLRLENPLNQ